MSSSSSPTLCQEHDVIAFTDDIYEHLVFEGEHIPLATLPGMAERTVSIHSMSKTYSVTGWRIGWTIAPPDLSVGIRRVHDFLTVGAAAPLQAAAVTALGFPHAYYGDLVAGYRERRDVLVPALEAAGFRVHEPAGAYYVMTDIRDLTDRTRRRGVRPPAHPRPGRGGRARLVVLLATRSSAGRSCGSRSRSGSRPCEAAADGWRAWPDGSGRTRVPQTSRPVAASGTTSRTIAPTTRRASALS